MVTSLAESSLSPLVETDPAWKPFGLFARLPQATEMLEERRKTEGVAPSAAPAAMTVLGVEMVVKNTFLEVGEEEVAGKLPRCSTAPGSLTAWHQRCLSDGPEDSGTESELSARGAASIASYSWSGHGAHRVDGDRAAGEVPSVAKVSYDAIAKKGAQCGDDDEISCSTPTCTPSSTMSSRWSSEEDDYELAQFETPFRLPREGFAMDTPVRDGGAGTPPVAAAASPSSAAASPSSANGAAPKAPPKQAPQVVTTIMVQNLKRSVTRSDFMLSLDSQGFAGKYNFVHLPKSFGSARNNGCAFVNFLKLEDAEEYSRSIARMKGSKMRAMPADVQGSANVAKAGSRKKTRIRNDTCRPLVVSGQGQDVLSHA